jgi:farnesyl-diphosphate farnesyltransferase
VSRRPGRTANLVGPLLKKVSRSFYLSVAILPAPVRPVVGIAYLLARAADTIADTRLLERGARIGHLHALRDELAAAAPGRLAAIQAAVGPGQSLPAERELLARLRECVDAYATLGEADRQRVRALLSILVDGMTQDLRGFPGEGEGKLRALETRADLVRYTYLVAGCVGEFWTDVQMAHRPRLRRLDAPHMRALGVRFGQGLQMTNVLRDAPRDLREGRCYLPRRDLEAHGLSPADLLDPAASPAARPLLRDLLGVALDWYGAGWHYTLAIPAREGRLRLACAWPLLIGLRTLEGLARTERWLDPAASVKVPRAEVYRLMAVSLPAVWSTPALRAIARRSQRRLAALL